MSDELTLSKQCSSPGQSGGLEPMQLARLLMILVASKPSMEPLNEPQIEIWYQALREFPAVVVKRAVAELALSDVQFVNLGQVFSLCRRKVPKNYSPHGTGQDAGTATRQDVERFAESLGLEF